MNSVMLSRNGHHLRAAPGDRADILIATAVQFDDFVLGSIQLFDRVGDLEIHDLGGFVQADRMFRRLEYLAGIGALALEDARAVVQAMGQHMDLGFFPGHDFAVEPDPTVALVKRNDGHGLVLLSGL